MGYQLKQSLDKFLIVVMCLLLPGALSATTIVDESFDDQNFSQISIYDGCAGAYCTNAGCPYDVGRGGSGYSLAGDHGVSSMCVLLTWGSIGANLTDGVYIRYYVEYAADYAVDTDFNNHKIFKISGDTSEGNIEIIWESLGDFSAIRYQCENTSSATFGGYASVTGFNKGAWHKIEIYVSIPEVGSSNAAIHLQIDDADVIDITGISLWKNSQAAYDNTTQLASLHIGGTPTGEGDWWLDDVLIVVGEGDLTENEPGATPTPTPTPTPSGQQHIRGGIFSGGPVR